MNLIKGEAEERHYLVGLFGGGTRAIDRFELNELDATIRAEPNLGALVRFMTEGCAGSIIAIVLKRAATLRVRTFCLIDPPQVALE